MKKLLLGLALCLLLMAFPACGAYAQEETEQPSTTPTYPPEWQQAVDSAPLTLEQLQEMTFPQMVTAVWDYVCNSWKQPLRLAALLCVVLVLGSIAVGLCTEGTDGKCAEYILCAAVITVCGPQMQTLFESLLQTIDDSRVMLAGFVPIFASVLAAGGQVGSAALYGGVFFSASMAFANALYFFCVPMLRILAALHIAGTLGGPFDFSSAASLLSKWLRWLLAVAVGVFSVVMSMQTAFVGATDSVSIQTGKLLGSSIPVVGRAVADAVVGVLGGIRLMKASVGFALLISLGVAFVPLLLRGLLYSMSLTVGGLVAASLGVGNVGRMLNGFADCLRLLLSILLLFYLMVMVGTLLMVLLGSSSI